MEPLGTTTAAERWVRRHAKTKDRGALFITSTLVSALALLQAVASLATDRVQPWRIASSFFLLGASLMGLLLHWERTGFERALSTEERKRESATDTKSTV
jgi:hypothetical protein